VTPRHPLFINRPKRATLKIMAGQKRRSGFKRLLRGGRGQGGPAAGEIGVIRKPHHGRIRIALCYPNAYELAMGNLGFHQAYHLFNLEDDVACERAMLDSRGRPLTIESGLPLREFEIIAFSISYEADLMNLAMMLHQSGVPLSPEKRRQKNSPLVLVGGVMAFLNPEPLAPFADVIAVGEGEAIIPPLLSAYRAARERARPELLAALARAPGVYIPSFYDVSYNGDGTIALRRALHPDAPATIRRTIKKDLSQGPACTRVFSEAAEFGDMALVELGRGCVQACRFCAAAYIYRPPRWTGAQAVEAALEKGFELRSRAGLVAASVTDHPEFARIRSWVRAQGRTQPPPRPDHLGNPGRHQGLRAAHHHAGAGDRRRAAAPRHRQALYRPHDRKGHGDDRRVGTRPRQTLLPGRPAHGNQGGRRGHGAPHRHDARVLGQGRGNQEMAR